MKNNITLRITSLLTMLVMSSGILFFRLSNQSYGLDEAFSLYISRSLGQMVHSLWYEEANMWLYYLVLHFWRALGEGEMIIRSLSVIFSLSSVFAIYKLANYLFNKQIALLSVVLTILNIFFVYNSQEARGYSLLLLLVTLSSYYFLRFEESRKYKVAYVITSTLSVYTHFFSGLVLLSHFIVSILKGKLRNYFLSFLIIGILFIPLVLAPSFHSHQIDWITRPNIISLATTIYLFAGDMLPLFLIYSALMVSLVPFFLKKYFEMKYILLVGWLVIPMSVAFVFSTIIKPVYQPDYLVISLIPFIILAAVAINGIRSKLLQATVVIAIVVFSIIRLDIWYWEYLNNPFKGVLANHRQDWRAATDFIKSNSVASDAVVFYGYYSKLPYSIYSPGDTKVVDIASSQYGLGGGDRPPQPNSILISTFSYPRVWLVLNLDSLEIYDGTDQYAEIVNDLENDYLIKSKTNFPGVEVVLFEKT